MDTAHNLSCGYAHFALQATAEARVVLKRSGAKNGSLLYLTDDAWGGNQGKTGSFLRDVLARWGHIIYPDVVGLGGTVGFHVRGEVDDVPVQHMWKEDNIHLWRFPLHGYSSDPKHLDVAVPDYTFYLWRAVFNKLRSTPKTHRGLMYRGRWSEDRGRWVKLLKSFQNESSFQKALPDGIDAAIVDDTRGRMTLEEMCTWTHTLHVDGVHWSYGLKYRFACGQVVFKVNGSQGAEEFWYDALEHGVNVYIFPDPGQAQSILEHSFGPRGAAVAAAGRGLASTYLSQRGLDCYYMLYLKRYYLPFLRRYLANAPLEGAESRPP